jgi:hypothetical protein
MNQQLLPEPKRSILTLQRMCQLHVTVFIRPNITAVSGVSFTAEMMLCTVQIQTQLLEFSSAEHYTSTLVANMFWTDAIHSRYVCFHPLTFCQSLHPTHRKVVWIIITNVSEECAASIIRVLGSDPWLSWLRLCSLSQSLMVNLE